MKRYMVKIEGEKTPSYFNTKKKMIDFICRMKYYGLYPEGYEAEYKPIKITEKEKEEWIRENLK